MKPLEIVISGGPQSGKTTAALNILRMATMAGRPATYFAPTQRAASWARSKHPDCLFHIASTTNASSLFLAAPPQIAVFDDAHEIRTIAEGHPIEIIRKRMSIYHWAQIIIVRLN